MSRLDLVGEVLGDARLRSGADCGDILPNAPQRPETVKGLKCGEDQQADAEREEAPEQGRAKLLDLRVDHLARLRDLESPSNLRSGQDHIAFGNAQRLAVELVAVVDMDLDVAMAILNLRRRSHRDREEGVGSLAADLEIDAGIRLDEPLIGRRAIEPDFAVGPISDAAIIALSTYSS